MAKKSLKPNWLYEFQDAGETVSIIAPDGTVKLIPKELFDKGNAAGYFIKNNKGEWTVNMEAITSGKGESMDTSENEMDSWVDSNGIRHTKTDKGYDWQTTNSPDLANQGNNERNSFFYANMPTELKTQYKLGDVDPEEVYAERQQKLYEYVQSKFPNASPEEIQEKVNRYDIHGNDEKGNGLEDFYAHNPDLFQKIQIINSKSAQEGRKFIVDWMNSPMYNKLTTASVNKDFAENEGMRRYLRTTKAKNQSGSEDATTAKVRLNNLRRAALNGVKVFTNKTGIDFLPKRIAPGVTLPGALGTSDYWRDLVRSTLNNEDRAKAIQKSRRGIINTQQVTHSPDGSTMVTGDPNTFDESFISYGIPGTIIISDGSVDPSVGAHEYSHITDYAGQAMPVSDKDLITGSYKSTFNPETDDPMGLKSTPSEVRARLNTIRSLKKWDVFNKKARLRDLKKIHNSQDLLDLQQMYDDKTILNLLNTVAQNNPEENEVGYAKDGGWLTKYENAGEVMVFSEKDPRYLQYLKDLEQYKKDSEDYGKALEDYNQQDSFIKFYGDSVFPNEDIINDPYAKENTYGDSMLNFKGDTMKAPHIYIFNPINPYGNGEENRNLFRAPDWFLDEYGNMTREQLIRYWGSGDRSSFKDFKDNELDSMTDENGIVRYAPKNGFIVTMDETDPSSRFYKDDLRSLSNYKRRLSKPYEPTEPRKVTVMDDSWQRGAYDNYEAGVHTPYRYKSYYSADDLGAGTYNTSVDEKLYQDINTNGLSLSHKRYFDPKTKKYVETVQTYTPEGDVDKTYTIGEEYDGKKFTSRDLDKLIFKAGTKKKKLGGWLTNYK